MKRIITISAAIMCLCVASYAQTPPQADPNDPQQMEQKARRLAEELLTGKSIIVRLYRDGLSDPCSFESTSVPLSGLLIELSSIESAFGRLSDSAIIVVLGTDQKDKAVSELLQDFVYAKAYKPTQWQQIDIFYPILKDLSHKWWTFLDAVGNPIPKAEIEMKIGFGYGENAEIWLGKAALDEKGRLKRIKRGCSESRFIFTVSAANYGTATAIAAGSPRPYNDPATIFVVPLVSVDSEAASRSVSGTVRDQDGNPIQDVEVSCEYLNAPGDVSIQSYIGTLGSSITNKDGWFNLYAPVCKDSQFTELSRKLMPVGSVYEIMIKPPKELNLRQYNCQTGAGAKLNVTLTAMDPNEYFHAFAFEDSNKPITDIELLKKTTITLNRDGREWLSLEYDDWKNGSYLPLGTLWARTVRWGDRFHFKPIELTADSPEKLIFKTGREILYRGSVVDEATGEPMPGVLVLADHHLDSKDPCTLKPEQWDRLYKEASEQSEATSEKALYKHRDRIAITDANGCFEIGFKPGLNNALYHFSALEKGFKARPIDSSYATHKIYAEGVVELPSIVMSLPQPEREKYFPTLIFEDEFGPVTDPNMLERVRLEVVEPNGPTHGYASYKYWLERRDFIPGTYYAKADWNEKEYVFEPVEITTESPETVFFKIQKIRDAEIVYRGQVINGITSAPIAGAFVMDFLPFHDTDLSDLAAEQAEAISSLESEADPNNPALGVLKGMFNGTIMTRTDSEGWFQIALKRKMVESRDSLLAVYKDYLGAEQQLKYIVVDPNNSGDPYRRFIYKEFPQDEDGCVTLPPMKLFPAGTIIVEPHIPTQAEHKDISIWWYTREGDTTPWLKDLWATPRDNQGGSVERKCELRPNQIQSVYVAANVELNIRVVLTQEDRWAPVAIPGVRLRQGEVLDLGRVAFKPALKVAVKVVDSKGAPIEGVSVVTLDGNGQHTNWGVRTDEYGIAMIYVPSHSVGQLVVEHWIDIMTDRRLREGIPYEVAGKQDADKIFTLQLSDEMLEHLFEEKF